MSSCTYKFKNASGEEVTITGQAEMKAFLADGGLEQLLPGKVLPWRGGSVAAPAESPKAKAKTGPATAQQAIDAFNADDSAAAMDVVARLKLEALNEVGAAIGFRPQIHENAKSYRSRLAEVAEKLTKTGREEGKKKRALWDRMSLLASDWDRMERHTGTPEGSYDGKWMTHAQARPYLLAEIGSLQSSPYFAEIRPMVENARPSIFNALDSVAAPAESPKVEAKPTAIDDFGTKLEGARKDAQASMAKEWTDDEIASQPFSKVWPAADIDAIEDPFEAALMFAARAEVPAKPRVAYKVKAWVAKVKMFRDVVLRDIGNLGRDRALDEMSKRSGLSSFSSKVKMLEALDRSQWKRIGTVSEYPDAYTFNADGTKTVTPMVVVEIDGKREKFEGSGSVLDVLDKINEKLGVAAEPKKMAFEVRGTGKLYFINKKGDKEYRKLKTFDTSKEAFAYIKDNYDDLVTAWEGVKDRDNVGKGDVRNETNRPRTGSDWRGNLSKARALQALINSAKADAKFVSDSFIRVSRLSHGDGDVNVPRPFGSSDWPSLPGGVNPKLHERLSYMAAVSIHLLRNLSEAESFGVELLGKGNVPLISAVQEAMLALGHDDKVLRSVVERIPVDVMDFLSREKISAESLFRDKSVLQSFFPVEGSVSIRAGVRDNPIVRLVREIARGGAEVVGADDTARIALEDDSALLTGQFNSGLEKSLFSHDVTPDEFDRTFSFKGVQFGNWVSQGAGGKDRQGLLNQAYDALMDLANIVGVPPKAISLNGSLGLAFGARGSGNASAHFEPSNLVINLTKTKGAGTLAHEWFHALDNYFSRQRGGEVKIGRGIGAQESYRTQNYITYRPEPMYVHKTARTAPMTKARLEHMRAESPKSGFFAEENWQIDPAHPQGVRPEVERAFADLVEALDNSPMKIRSSMNDKGADGYWSRIIERGARAFENYVIHKMRLNGYDNDYLANVRKVDDFPRSKGRYPYLLDEEVAPVAEAFDNLFAEVKTKETDQGVAMFRTDVLPDTLTIDGVDRPTKNSKGQPIHPTEEGVRSFWRWFSGSKAVDAEGRPLVVYHGTTSEIEGGFKPGSSEWDAGIFFTSSAEVAGSVYAQGQAAPNEEGIRAALAGMSNDAVEALAEKLRRQNGGFEFWPEDYGPDMDIPYSKQMADYAIYSFDEYEDSPSSALSIAARALGVPAKVPASGSNVVAGMMRLRNPLEIDGSRSEFDQEQQAEWMEQAKAGGHDGLIIRHYKDGGFGGPDNFRSAGRHDVFVAFAPEQIKSATGNAGTFDPSSPDIRFRTDFDDRPARAGWTESRIDRLIGEFAYDFDSARTKAYAAFVNPDDFLSATTPKSERDKLEAEAKPLDREGLAGETQPIYLQVRETDEDGVFKIVGHEGRHRMMALRDAGYSRVPVALIFPDAVYDASEIEEPYFIAQKFGDGTKAAKGFSARSATPITSGNRAELVEEFSSNASGNNDIRFRNDYPDTQAFREWFGNSKMTNKAGEPLLFMHGSPASFEAFDSSKLGTSSSHTSSGLGHFFTRDRATAEKYADGGNIYTGWLRIEKPYVMMLEEAQAFDDAAESAKRRAELQKQGYDGAVILDDEGKPWATVAFEPWQFKSTDNNGSFDEFDDRMRFRDDPSSMRDAPAVPRDQAEEFIRKFVAEYPGAPQIMLADSFYQLPEDIQSDALEQGSGPTRAKGALKNGKAYVVLNTHTSMADLEASVFHEVLGHAGIRKLLGPAFAQELNKMFIGLGGYSKLYQIMSRRGMGRQFEGYYDAVQRAREKNPEVWTEFLASSILTEEVFAHIAEQKNAKALRDRFMALVGMVRDWLRRNGFARLASLGESDIVFLLQRARAGLKNGSGVIRDGVTIGETVIVDAEGRPVAKKGSPDYEMLKAVSERMGLRETNGPTVFSNSLPEEGKPGDDARMDNANSVAGKQAPTLAGDVEAGGADKDIRKWLNGSAFVNSDGSPMVFFHGTPDEQFESIDVPYGGAYFAEDPSVSEFFATDKGGRYNGSRAFYLKADNVFDATKPGADKVLDRIEAEYDNKTDYIDPDDGEYLPLRDWVKYGYLFKLGREVQNEVMESLSAEGYDAVRYVDASPATGDAISVVVFDQNQVRIKNTPPASASSDAPTVFRTVTPEPVRTRLADLMDSFKGDSAKTFNWWQRTIGSQYGKAKSDRDFGRVYDAAHAFLDGVADFAKTASTLAPNILPHLDTLKDVAKGLDIKKQWSDSKDYQAVSSAIFEGTLANGTTGKVWSDAELQDRFNLNQQQIDLYREFRKSVDFSLDTLAASELARLARASQMDVADRDASLDDALSFYLKQLNPRIKAARAAVEGRGGEIVARHIEERATLEEAAAYITEKQADLLRKEMQSRHDKEIAEVMGAERKLEELRASFTEKVEQIRKLQSEGYAPLMRFGQYTVDVVKLDANGKPELGENGEPDRPFFGMFETESEARRAAKALSEDYPDHVVTQGVLSVDASQLYKGVTPETAEMFARMLGTDKDEAFQTYLKQAVANRSAMKRLINRLGIDGFSNDVPRVLASFITSNARLASGNWHFGEMAKAVEAIPKQKGDVKDEAIRLMQYVQNPQEEAAGLRGFLFFSFLGGSIASAMVNLTQTFSTTLPYLHQFGGAAVAKALPKAMALSGKMMTKGLAAVPDGELKDALKKASDEGVVDPQEIHLLMAESGGNGSSVGVSSLAGAINKEWATPAARVTRSLTQAWGMFFGAAEKYNRHVAFIAAWEVAPDGVDRYEFAKSAVTETQFDYTKASRPNWARGAVGATLFTFKTFMVNYVEFMSRLPPRERALALAVLFLMAGMSGMPGADDLDDVVDTVAQKMGYNWNNSAARHAWLAKTLTAGGADFVERGLSSLLPLDVSARLGMGNIVPGTGILMKSNDKPARDIQEFFGPIASVFAGGKEVFDDIGSGKGVLEMVRPIAPKAYGDLYQAVDMIQTGQYRDRAGRKVVDVSALDATLKAVGFQPNAVAGPRRIERMLAQSAAMHRAVRQDIHELMARGRYENDADKVAAARGMMKAWNEKNPETPIRLNPTGVATRVRAMRQSSADRLVKATPKDMRGALSAELAVTP